MAGRCGRDWHPLRSPIQWKFPLQTSQGSTPLDYNSTSGMPRQADFQVELLPLHSPLLRESLLVSFPPLNNMLKSSGSSYLISGRRLKFGLSVRTHTRLCVWVYTSNAVKLTPVNNTFSDVTWRDLIQCGNALVTDTKTAVKQCVCVCLGAVVNTVQAAPAPAYYHTMQRHDLYCGFDCPHTHTEVSVRQCCTARHDTTPTGGGCVSFVCMNLFVFHI